jgi:hypothetical protein
MKILAYCRPGQLGPSTPGSCREFRERGTVSSRSGERRSEEREVL